MKKRTISSFAVAVMLLFNSCAVNPVSGKREVMFMSESQEIAMGQQADPQIVAQFGLYQDPALQRFINEQGQKMAALSHRSHLNYEFKIVDSPVINAFAVPGGYVYFTRGIMAHFNNEAQFAGVLGHEIGHITARHSARQQSKAMLAQVGILAGMVISPTLAQFGEAASQGLGLLFLKFGRDDERESDRLGVEYSTKIGYDAKEMADFFMTLQRQQTQGGGQALPDFLSTHPNPADRYETVHQLAADWKQKANVNNPAINRNSYLKMIDGMIYGEDPRQGYVENSNFYHPELKFQFAVPTAWQTQNSPQQVQMAPQDGKAMMLLRLAQGESLQAAAQQALQGYGLQATETKNVTVNGLPALAVIAAPATQQQQQQQQQDIRALLYFIQYGKYIYNLVGVTATANFNAYAPVFTNTMQSFRQLTDASKMNRQPERIKITTVAQNSTLSQVLRSNNIPDNRLDELAILNGMQLNDQLQKGTLIKVVAK